MKINYTTHFDRKNKNIKFTFLHIQSILKTPPRALADKPGGKSHGTGGPSLRDSDAKGPFIYHVSKFSGFFDPLTSIS